MQELVSVIIPTYNYGHLLESTVKSVMTQSYSQIEILVIDDCSTDNTSELMATLSKEDIRICYIRQDRNRGVSAARNRGLKEAKGGFIAFLDGDDLWEKYKIEKQIAFLQAHPEIGFTNCGGLLFGTKEEPFTGNHHRHKNIKKLDVDLLYHAAIPCPMSCLIFRSEILEKTGGFDESLHYAEDRDLLIRALKYSGFKAMDEKLVRIRKHSENYAHKHFDKSLKGKIRFVRKTFPYLAWKDKHYWFHAMGEQHYAACYQCLNQGKLYRAWMHHLTAPLFNPLLLLKLKYHVQTLKCLLGGKDRKYFLKQPGQPNVKR